MSPREQLQHEIYDFLVESKRFNAPYGVIAGMKPYAKGKVRTITFGIARYLDGEITILSPKCIMVGGRGPLAYKFAGTYGSKEDLIKKFS